MRDPGGDLESRGSKVQVYEPSPEAIRAALPSLLSSSSFASANRSSRFLRYVVEETLAGNRETIKESVLGCEVFDRAPDFDPRIDAIVRVEATKLRTRLTDYYERDGAQASVLIEIPKGSYVPRFSDRVLSEGNTTSVDEPPMVLPLLKPKVRGGPGLPIGLSILLAVSFLGVCSYFLWSRSKPAAPLSSIAVLPFVNLSSDSENEYFSDGLTEQLTDVLARSGLLRVAARTSAFAFKGKGEDVGEIGAKLHVDALLEGSVRKSGGQLRITAQLIRISDGLHIWSQTYDRPSNDIFAVQDDISQSILAALATRITDNKSPRRIPQYTNNAEAFDFYLRGKSEANQWMLEPALKHFNQSIGLDPNLIR